MISSIIPETDLVKNTGSAQTRTESTLPSVHSGNLTLDANAMDKLVSMLTNLYSDENLAVLREYSTNAADSHKAAGNTAPIEVELPSALNPQLVIRDFGLGLSKDDIIDTYTQYGASKKTLDLNQVGAFGLGCKSGLALATQFTVLAVKDGKRIVVVISQGDNGAPGYSIVSETDTDEPNGVTIRIAVPDPSLMRSRANEFFATWKSGTVLVDGQQPASVWENSNKFYARDGLLISPSKNPYWRGSSHKIVMGNVAYQIDDSEITVTDTVSRTLRSVDFYVEVPIGSVDLPPSREGIRYSDRTKRFLSSLCTNIANEAKQVALEDIASAPSIRVAFDKSTEWLRSNILSDKEAVYNGEPILREEDLEHVRIKYVAPANGDHRGDMDYARAKRTEAKAIFYSNMSLDETFYYIKCADAVEVAQVRKSLRSYLLAENDMSRVVYVGIAPLTENMRAMLNVSEVAGAEVIEKAKVYLAERRKNMASAPRAVRVPVAQTYKVYSTANDMIVTHESMTTEDIAKIEGRVYYTRASDWASFDENVVRVHSRVSSQSVNVVILSTGQRALSLTKALPEAIPFSSSDVTNFTRENVDVNADMLALASKVRYADWRTRQHIRRLASLNEGLDIPESVKTIIATAKDAVSFESVVSALGSFDDDKGLFDKFVAQMNTFVESVPYVFESYGNDVSDEHMAAYIKAFAKAE